MHRSSNSTVFTDPAITKSTKPDTGVPIWLDIVIGVSFGITVVGCLFIFLHRRNLRTNDPWIMSHKEVDFTSYEAKKQDQYDDFVAGACGAGYGIYATMKTNFSIYSPSWSYDASNAGRWYDEDRHPQSRGIVDRRIIQPLQAVKLAP